MASRQSLLKKIRVGLKFTVKNKNRRHTSESVTTGETLPPAGDDFIYSLQSVNTNNTLTCYYIYCKIRSCIRKLS